MKKLAILQLFALSLLFVSCGSQRLLPDYLQNIKDSTGLPTNIVELRAEPNDLLSIQVFSASTRPEISDVLYNLPCSGGEATTGGAGDACGYLVDGNGNIEFPRVGTLYVNGLTKSEISSLVKRKINEKDSVLTNPSVLVRFKNLKFTVIGEVRAPGVKNFPGERINILEAIGLAGDVTDFGMKDQVRVIREKDGKRDIGIINLSSDSLFVSPYFNLQQNDVVLVTPTPRKAKRVDDDVTLRRLSFGLSVITAFALIYNVINR